MKKLSNIIESVWGKVLDRGAGEVIRKEDDVDFLEPDAFVAYIRKNYRIDNTPCDIENRANGLAGTGTSNIFIPICVDGTKNIKLGVIYFDYNEEEVYTNSSIKKYIPKLWAKLNQDFDLLDDNGLTLINPKDTSRKVNNSYVLELLNYICDNLDDTAKPCLFRKTNESVWGKVLDRGAGETIRKEEKIDHLDAYDFYEYLKNLYISKNPQRDVISGPFIDPVIVMPFMDKGFYYNIYINYPDERDNIESISIPDRCVTFYNGIENVFKLESDPNDEKSITVFPKDGSKITNSFVVMVIDYLLNNTKDKNNSIFIKKERS